MPTTDEDTKTLARARLYHELPGFDKKLGEIMELLDLAGAAKLHGELLFFSARLRRARRLIGRRRKRPGHCRHCGSRSCYCCTECGQHVAEHDESCSHWSPE